MKLFERLERWYAHPDQDFLRWELAREIRRKNPLGTKVLFLLAVGNLGYLTVINPAVVAYRLPGLALAAFSALLLWTYVRRIRPKLAPARLRDMIGAGLDARQLWPGLLVPCVPHIVLGAGILSALSLVSFFFMFMIGHLGYDILGATIQYALWKIPEIFFFAAFLVLLAVWIPLVHMRFLNILPALLVVVGLIVARVLAWTITRVVLESLFDFTAISLLFFPVLLALRNAAPSLVALLFACGALRRLRGPAGDAWLRGRAARG